MICTPRARLIVCGPFRGRGGKNASIIVCVNQQGRQRTLYLLRVYMSFAGRQSLILILPLQFRPSSCQMFAVKFSPTQGRVLHVQTNTPTMPHPLFHASTDDRHHGGGIPRGAKGARACGITKGLLHQVQILEEHRDTAQCRGCGAGSSFCFGRSGHRTACLPLYLSQVHY